MDFVTLWATIQNRLSEDTPIRNWTHAKGFYGEDFGAFARERYVECTLPRGSVQHVPKGDFERVFQVWESYLKGQFMRSQMRDMTRFSKYIISILHQVLSASGPSLVTGETPPLTGAQVKQECEAGDLPVEKAPGDSSEQRKAERWMLSQLADKLGVSLQPKVIHLERGSYLEVDGYCPDLPRPILCEVWAHIGRPKSAQKHKVMCDALKLLFAKRRLGVEARCMLVFGDEQAAAFFEGTSWMAECLEDAGIETMVIPMGQELADTVGEAQKRQYR